MQRTHLASLGLIATAVLWGGNHVVIRDIADQTDPLTLVFWRWTLSAVVLLLLGARPLWQARRILRKDLGRLTCLGVLNCVFFSLAIIGAPFGTSAANVGLIQATAPLWITVTGLLFLSEKVSLRNAIGMGLGFAGAVLLISSGPAAANISTELWWGDALALIGTLIWAGYSILLRKMQGVLHPVTLFSAIVLTGYVVLIPCYVILLLAGSSGDISILPPREIWPAVVYIGLGATLLGNLFWNLGVHALGPTTAAQFLFLAPICSIGLGTYWLDEYLSILGWLGAIMIISGLILSTVHQQEAK
ncbi:MAG: DMT family transporter [Aestuariivita sp.]|nr:DMT family transporter [Aestuariivita sp.]MCY4203166.1 DMT family transporter [Aestuariivita sp.]